MCWQCCNICWEWTLFSIPPSKTLFSHTTDLHILFIGPLHRHLRSNVHPFVAILPGDKQTTGHCTKQWGNIRLFMKMIIKYIPFLVIFYDFFRNRFRNFLFNCLAKKVNFLEKILMLEMIFLSFTWSSIEIVCKIVLCQDLLVLQHAWLTSSYVA